MPDDELFKSFRVRETPHAAGGTGRFVLIPEPVLEAYKAGVISEGAFVLYAILDQYRDRRTKKAWPGLRRLSTETRRAINTVMKRRDELAAAGLIRVTVPDDRTMPLIYDLLYGPEPGAQSGGGRVSKPETRAVSQSESQTGADSCRSQSETDPSSEIQGIQKGVAAGSAAAPDMQLLEAFFAEAEKATGAPPVPRYGRDRKIARQILMVCAKPVLAPTALEEAVLIAVRYCTDGRAKAWTVTLPGLLQHADQIRQRMAAEQGVRPAGAPLPKPNHAVRDQVLWDKYEAANGKRPESREQLHAWAREQGLL